MEAEEDIFLVIVGDQTLDGSSDDISAPISIQQIYLDETEGVDNLLEMAERYGEYIDVQVKVEPEELECEEESPLQPSECNNGDDEEYIPEDTDECNYILDHDLMVEKEVHRYTMLKPSQRKSFVGELRNHYPELKQDTDLLISILSEVMKSVKVPPLPKDYYKMVFNKPMCIICDAITETIPAAGRHYQEKHGERYLVCYACGVDFRSTTNLYKHEKRCVSPDAQVVLKARAAFVGQKGRGRPYLTRRPRPHNTIKEAKFKCNLCSAAFHTRLSLESHQYHHSGERPFRCHVCVAAYTSQSALMRHAKMHTDIQFICDHCNRSFKVKSSLIAHMDTHRPLRKHACVECGRRFAQRAAMLLHVNRDHRLLPPPCACQICPKRYMRMSLLKEHMKKAHGMTLITRKMFSRYLPTMTEKEVQKAKVVLRSEAPSIHDIIENHPREEISEEHIKRDEEIHEEMLEDETNSEVYSVRELETDTDKFMHIDEFIQYTDDINNTTQLDNNSHKVFIIKNGEVININVLDESSINLLNNNSSVEVTRECLQADTGELKILSMPDL